MVLPLAAGAVGGTAMGAGGVAAGGTAAGGAVAGSSIPAWVPYALQIAGAASGNRNLAGVGSALGGLRGAQQGEAQSSILQKVLASGGEEGFNESDVLDAGGTITQKSDAAGSKISIDIPKTAGKALGGNQQKPSGVAGGSVLPTLTDQQMSNINSALAR